MYSWVMDFNLRGDGEEVERFLLSMIREWPDRYEKIDGVLGTMFLGNAFGLGGPYTFRMVLEIKSVDTLRNVDQLYKTDAGWRKAISDFRKHRQDVQSRLLKHSGGDSPFTATVNQTAQPGFVFVHEFANQANSDAVLKSQPSSSATYSALVQPAAGHSFEVWSNLPDLKSVEQRGTGSISVGSLRSGLYSSFRIVDGVLVGAA